MARCGDVYENHVTGERAVVLRGDEDGGGQSVIVHLTVRAGGAVVGEHVHPALTERFVVMSGTLATRIGGVEGTLTSGEEATAPPGTPHDWWNSGAVDANVLVEISPPNPRFEMAIATTFGLANAGKTNAKGMPNPLLGAIARRRGYRGIYPEYLKPHGRATPDPEAMALAGLGPSGACASEPIADAQADPGLSSE
jgi:mannose-6-phosphate isomerase-like protein (cupin superfamily)